VVNPSKEPNHRYGVNSEHHGYVSKYRLSGHGGYYFREHTEGWKDHDVNDWVRIEPEKVLVKQWVST